MNSISWSCRNSPCGDLMSPKRKTRRSTGLGVPEHFTRCKLVHNFIALYTRICDGYTYIYIYNWGNISQHTFHCEGTTYRFSVYGYRMIYIHTHIYIYDRYIHIISLKENIWKPQNPVLLSISMLGNAAPLP